jgi:hypothetical protein
MSAGRLGRIVEQGETVAREMRHRVLHFKFRADGRPVFAVEAVEEAGDVFHLFTISRLERSFDFMTGTPGLKCMVYISSRIVRRQIIAVYILFPQHGEVKGCI